MLRRSERNIKWIIYNIKFDPRSFSGFWKYAWLEVAYVVIYVRSVGDKARLHYVFALTVIHKKCLSKVLTTH